MTEIETNVLQELEVLQGALAQGEGEEVEGIEAPVTEELEKPTPFLAVWTDGWSVAKKTLI